MGGWQLYRALQQVNTHLLAAAKQHLAWTATCTGSWGHMQNTAAAPGSRSAAA